VRWLRVRFSFRNASGSPFELWVGIVAIVNALFYDVDRNPIHALLKPWDQVWVVLYGIAGAFIVYGLLRNRGSRIEAVGLIMLIGGLVIQITVFASLGVPTLTGTLGTLITLSTLVCLVVWRLRILLRASKVEDHRE
jgi:hypothetical protein